MGCSRADDRRGRRGAGRDGHLRRSGRPLRILGDLVRWANAAGIRHLADLETLATRSHGNTSAVDPGQRTAALAKAAEARAARAEIKARLKMGSMTLAQALASDDNNVGKLKVVSMLESLPGVGKVKASRDGRDRHRRQPSGPGTRRNRRAALLQQLGS